jgi:hypothetical protein
MKETMVCKENKTQPNAMPKIVIYPNKYLFSGLTLECQNNYFIFQNPLLAIKKSFMKFRQQIYAPSLASCCLNSKSGAIGNMLRNTLGTKP